MKRGTRLTRYASLTRGGPLVRRTPLRSTPSRRARPGEPLADWCEAAIDAVCEGRSVHRHHVLRRSQGGDDTTPTLDVCRACHGAIHANVGMSIAYGFLQRPNRQQEAS